MCNIADRTNLLILQKRRVGCTVARHKELGAHAGINARAGETWRNDPYEGPTGKSLLDVYRDCWDAHDPRRLVIRRWRSVWCQKHLGANHPRIYHD